MLHHPILKNLAGACFVAACGSAVAACGGEPTAGKVVASYDPFTSRLVQLSADLDNDGRIDQRTYMDGNRPLRGEADIDKDGRVDRWEYFDDRAALIRVGTSSRNDGIEDTWSWTATTPAGESRVTLSTRRDRQLDQQEFFKGTALVRTEGDTNADGRPDKWEVYEAGVLREARFDTTFANGRANRRLIYDERGQLVVIEADDDGDGRFERVVVSPGAGVSPATPTGARR